MSKKVLKIITDEKNDLNQETKDIYTESYNRINNTGLTELLTSDKLVLNALRDVRVANRNDLVELCSLPRTTIYDALIRLERLGAVERYKEDRVKRGRPKTLYRIL